MPIERAVCYDCIEGVFFKPLAWDAQRGKYTCQACMPFDVKWHMLVRNQRAVLEGRGEIAVTFIRD